jgi:hypothetical protein
MIELRAGGQKVDGEDVEAEMEGAAPGLGHLVEVGGGHAAEHALLVRIDGDFGGEEVAGGAGFDFHDDKCASVPGNEIEVAGVAFRAPAAGDEGVTEGAKMEEGGVFAAFAGEEVRCDGTRAVGAGAEPSVKAAFEVEGEGRKAHGPEGCGGSECGGLGAAVWR